MKFSADRLAQLAGLRGSGARTLSEASNRSMHDDKSVSDEAEYRFGKNQLSEREVGGTWGQGEREQSRTDPGDEDYTWREGDEDDGAPMDALEEEGQGTSGTAHVDEPGYGQGKYLDEVVEIDERMLRQEIRRMRSERVEENQLRDIIRKEIGTLIKSKTITPRRSTRGVTLGMTGPGFKR